MRLHNHPPDNYYDLDREILHKYVRNVEFDTLLRWGATVVPHHFKTFTESLREELKESVATEKLVDEYSSVEEIDEICWAFLFYSTKQKMTFRLRMS